MWCSWQHKPIDAFKTWWWRRVAGVACLERKTNAWVLEDIRPEWNLYTQGWYIQLGGTVDMWWDRNGEWRTTWCLEALWTCGETGTGNGERHDAWRHCGHVVRQERWTENDMMLGGTVDMWWDRNGERRTTWCLEALWTCGETGTGNGERRTTWCLEALWTCGETGTGNGERHDAWRHCGHVVRQEWGTENDMMLGGTVDMWWDRNGERRTTWCLEALWTCGETGTGNGERHDAWRHCGHVVRQERGTENDMMLGGTVDMWWDRNGERRTTWCLEALWTCGETGTGNGERHDAWRHCGHVVRQERGTENDMMLGGTVVMWWDRNGERSTTWCLEALWTCGETGTGNGERHDAWRHCGHVVRQERGTENDMMVGGTVDTWWDRNGERGTTWCLEALWTCGETGTGNGERHDAWRHCGHVVRQERRTTWCLEALWTCGETGTVNGERHDAWRHCGHVLRQERGTENDMMLGGTVDMWWDRNGEQRTTWCLEALWTCGETGTGSGERHDAWRHCGHVLRQERGTENDMMLGGTVDMWWDRNGERRTTWCLEALWTCGETGTGKGERHDAWRHCGHVVRQERGTENYMMLGDTVDMWWDRNGERRRHDAWRHCGHVVRQERGTENDMMLGGTVDMWWDRNGERRTTWCLEALWTCGETGTGNGEWHDAWRHCGHVVRQERGTENDMMLGGTVDMWWDRNGERRMTWCLEALWTCGETGTGNGEWHDAWRHCGHVVRQERGTENDMMLGGTVDMWWDRNGERRMTWCLEALWTCG